MSLHAETPRNFDIVEEVARLKAENAVLTDQISTLRQCSEQLTEVNQLLVESTRRLSTDADPEVFLESLVRVLAESIGASPVTLFEYDAAEGTLAMRIHYDHGTIRRGPSGAEVPLFAAPFPADITPAWATVVDEVGRFFTDRGEPETEGYAWPGVMEWMQREGMIEPGIVGLFAGQQPVGCMGIAWSHGRRRPNPADFPLIEALAQQAAVGLHLVKLADEARKNAVTLARDKEARERVVELARANEALHRSTASLLRQEDAHEFLATVLHDTCAVCGAIGAGIFRYDEPAETIRMEAFVSSGKSVNLATDSRFGIWRAAFPTRILAGWDALRRGEISCFDNEDADPARWSASVAWQRQMGHRIVSIIPMLVGQKFLGFLGLCFATPIPPTPGRIDQARALAGHAGLALQLGLLTDDLRREAAARATLIERNRISRDLHDTLAQGFTGILAQLGVIEGALETAAPRADGAITHALARAGELARSSLAEARRSMSTLREGAASEAAADSLESKLKKHLDRMTSGTRLHVRLDVDASLSLLPAPVEETLCRIALEALTNSLRHGGQQATEFRLYIGGSDGRVKLLAQDNGCGFDLEKIAVCGGFGLAGMRERAALIGGRVEFCSVPGEGMAVTVEIPIAKHGES